MNLPDCLQYETKETFINFKIISLGFFIFRNYIPLILVFQIAPLLKKNKYLAFHDLLLTALFCF